MYVNVYHLSARHDTVHLPVVAVAVPFSTSVALLRRNTYPRMDTNTGPRARAEAHRPCPEQYRTLQNRSDQSQTKPSSAELGQSRVTYLPTNNTNRRKILHCPAFKVYYTAISQGVTSFTDYQYHIYIWETDYIYPT